HDRDDGTGCEPDEGVRARDRHGRPDDVPALDELLEDGDRAGEHPRSRAEHVDIEDPQPEADDANADWGHVSDPLWIPRGGHETHLSFALSTRVPCSASRTAVTRSKYSGDSRSASSRVGPRSV